MNPFDEFFNARPTKPEVEALVDNLMNDMDVLEAIAAIQDGVLSHDDMSPALIERILTDHSPEQIADQLGLLHPLVALAESRVALAESRMTSGAVHGSSPPLKLATRTLIQGASARLRATTRPRVMKRLIAVAATLAVVALTIVLLLPNTNKKSDPSSFEWPSPTVASFGPIIALPMDRLRPSTIEPDWNASSGFATMGSAVTIGRQQLQRATVILRSPDGMGSGFLISAEGWILTAYHVVASVVQQASLRGEAASVDVIFAVVRGGRIAPSDERVRATVYRVDPEHDIALVKLNHIPASLLPLSFVPIAESLPDEGEEVVVIGSPGGLAPWNIRTGNVARIYQHPTDLSENVGLPARTAGVIQRVQAEVIQTDIGISPGDSGGPLLNRAGHVIGITFATPANIRAGSAGLHIALPHIQAMVSSPPTEPELVPPDFFAAADPALSPANPRANIVDGFIQSVVWPFLARTEGSDAASSAQVVAWVTFVDHNRRNPSPSRQEPSLSAMMPRGLWSMEDRGQFRFTAVRLVRSDGLIVIGTTDTQGNLSEVRINRDEGRITQVAYTRHATGIWRLAPALVGAPLDTSTAGGSNTKVLERGGRPFDGMPPTRGPGPTPSDRSQPNRMP